MSAPTLWMDNDAWWIYGVHPTLAAPLARFHGRNRFHLRMAMSQTPELEDPAYWEPELTRRQTAMQSGQAVHLVGIPKEPAGSEVGALISFWAIEHGDFQGCTMSILLDRYKLHRVMANHLPENLRSAQLLRRLGFAVEGYARDFIRINGRWRDVVLLSLLVT
jgi:ribosomal-protein-alanine N-acetyltransferase